MARDFDLATRRVEEIEARVMAFAAAVEVAVTAARPRSTTAEAAAPTADGIDYGRIVTKLRKARKPMQAALVEYMATRDEALFEDVAGPVHGDADASDGAIEANVRRTKDTLAAMDERLAFKAVSGRIFRETSEK
jgi:hypothetical protein